MARSGSLAALEQRLAAQRREDDRLARERRQRERDSERVRQQEHLASLQQQAEEQTAAVEERMKELGEYDRKVTEERAKAAARNSYVTSRQSAFAAGDPEAVEWFVGCVLRVSPYPDGFPREYQVAYDRGTRDVTVDLELPPRSVVPAVRGYRYVKARDAVEPVPRQESDITQAHERLVACVALRALHEIFGALPAELVQAVALTGWVSSVDRATGAPMHPRLLTMRAERAAFGTLTLDAVDPIACLAHLTTPVSPA